MKSSFVAALQSIGTFGRLAAAHKLRLNTSRLRKSFAVEDGNYAIFRETVQLDTVGEPVVLVVGFRLKLIRSSRLLHWLFQGVCIITTPIWSGLPGFRVKLWLVDPDTKNYAGIYDWRGVTQAQDYLDYLLPILRFFSVGGTVWARKLDGQDFEKFLSEHS